MANRYSGSLGWVEDSGSTLAFGAQEANIPRIRKHKCLNLIFFGSPKMIVQCYKFKEESNHLILISRGINNYLELRHLVNLQMFWLAVDSNSMISMIFLTKIIPTPPFFLSLMTWESWGT